MKKLIVVLTVLCLVCSTAAMAEGNALTFPDGVEFGMSQDEVTASNGNTNYEVDKERTRGSVTFTEVKYENTDIGDSMKGDLAYLFLEDKLVAIRVDFDKMVNTFEVADKYLTEKCGEGQELDLKTLGNGVFAVDDDGHPEGKAKAWTGDGFAVVLEEDDDGDIDVTFVDLTADYIK